ncbi:MAG: aminodeoxychorismate lyase [Alteromonadales bacterium]|nr:aminodeoxychorismate lyase [Alteromonadales bacterium]
MLINGIDAEYINATDRGLAYGDGLFSTMKVEYGELQLWGFHLQRLQLGAQKLFFPEIDWLQLSNEVKGVAKQLNDEKESVIKVIITRGSGGRGYSITGCESPLRIISTSAYPSFYHQWQQQGIELILCETIVSSNAMLAGLKTLNRLEQVLIKRELESKGAVEGIVCDNNGYVIEACSANLFIFLNGVWQTPKLELSGVAGVQRRNIIERAKQVYIEIKQTNIHKDQLLDAEAICLSNALMGLVPVKKFQGREFDSNALKQCKALQLLISIGS